MRIGIITPAPPRSRYGNRVTAVRWARILKKLGHRVRVKQEYDGGRYDLLIALHARKSHSAVKQFHRQHPESPRIVALQPNALDELSQACVRRQLSSTSQSSRGLMPDEQRAPPLRASRGAAL